MKVFYGQDLYDSINPKEYKMGIYKVGQLASNGLDWGIIEGFSPDRNIVVRVPLPGNFVISQHEKQQGLDGATCAYESWDIKDVLELEDRAIIKMLKVKR